MSETIRVLQSEVDKAAFKYEKEASSLEKNEHFLEQKPDDKVSEKEAFEKIKNILDDRARAEREDPMGLYDAVEADLKIQRQASEEVACLKDDRNRYLELSGQVEVQSSAMASLKIEKEKRQRQWMYKIKQLFHLKDKKIEELDSRINEIESLFKEIQDLLGEGANDPEQVQVRIEKAKAKENYGENQKEFLRKFETALPKEDKLELLKPEVLKGLSTEEYLSLWRRLNPHYVSHVVRQGVRDHNAAWFHSAGMGEMHDGFKNILKSGKQLKSALDLESGCVPTELLNNEKKFNSFMEKSYFSKGIPEQLFDGDINAQTIANVKGGGHSILKQPRGYWADRTSVHFMADAVGDDLYGAETDNEIFFVFPSDVMFSQYYPQNEVEYALRSSSGHHNDLLIQAENGRIDIDAGIVFIPKSTIVNPENGSKYMSFDSNGGVLASENGSTMTAEEYWQGYFSDHPEMKPAHVIYYDGSPATAVAKLKQENGVTTNSVGATAIPNSRGFTDFGFGDRLFGGETEMKQIIDQQVEQFYDKVAKYIYKKRTNVED